MTITCIHIYTLHNVTYDRPINPLPPKTQTFINSVSSFRVLERPQFAILQRAVFPWYFGIQTVAPVVLALTYPGIGGRSVLAALEAGASVYDRSVAGVLQQPGAVLAPLAVACVTGLANWAYFLPETNKLTARRRVQGMSLLRLFVLAHSFLTTPLLPVCLSVCLSVCVCMVRLINA